MINETLMHKLNLNWGIPAECLNCMVEARIYDPESCWECFLIAINPYNNIECKVILVNELRQVLLQDMELPDILGRWNVNGDFMELDAQWVPRNANWVFKILKERHPC